VLKFGEPNFSLPATIAPELLPIKPVDDAMAAWAPSSFSSLFVGTSHQSTARVDSLARVRLASRSPPGNQPLRAVTWLLTEASSARIFDDRISLDRKPAGEEVEVRGVRPHFPVGLPSAEFPTKDFLE